MKPWFLKVLLILGIIVLVICIKVYGLQDYFHVDFIKKNLEHFQELYARDPVKVMALFMGIYIGATALSLPGAATLLTLLGGALFGLYGGVVLVSFASTIGATLAFLVSRFLVRDYVQKKFEKNLKSINEGVKKDGWLHLLSLRLLPIFPFFLINVVMGLTPMRAWTFFFVSQLGMLLGTIIYVNTGRELSRIESLQDILSPSLLLAFTLLGIFPLLSRRVFNFFQRRKAYKPFISRKPRQFDYNMIVIGGGAAGLVTSYIARVLKAKVALIEREQMGGDCLYTGCVPSKALLKVAKLVHQAQRGEIYGLSPQDPEVDLSRVMERVHQVIKRIQPHDSKERYEKMGVHCLKGQGLVASPWEVRLEDRSLYARTLVVATGARPFLPPIPGISQVEVLTSSNLWKLEELPQKFLILGGGPIGVEMAQAFQRLGSQVTLVESSPQLLGKEDEDVGEFIKQRLQKEGVKVWTSRRAVEFQEGSDPVLVCEKKTGETVRVSFDRVLVATGRSPFTEGFGLEDLGLEKDDRGGLAVNRYMQTSLPNIYACGDVVSGSYQLTHMAAHQAWYCAVNGLLGGVKKFSVDTSAVPWATYTDPEVATVGSMEKALKNQGTPYEVVRYDLGGLDRAIADGEDYGFIKVCMARGKDRILGATIVGTRGSDCLMEFITAIKQGWGLGKILSTIHPYPTTVEGNKHLAGRWRQGHAPEKALEALGLYFKWRRG